MEDLTSSVSKYFNNKKEMTVLDVRFNDGSLLNFFHKKKFNTIGIEAHGDKLKNVKRSIKSLTIILIKKLVKKSSTNLVKLM